MKKFRKFTALLLLAIMIVAALPVISGAEEEETSTLTIHHELEGVKIAGAEFKLYYIADRIAYSQFDLVDPYKSCGLDLETLDAQNWNETAKTLESQITRDGIAETAKAVVNENGDAGFEGLAAGLYLVTGSTEIIGNYEYKVDPFLTALPGFEDDAYKYAVEINSKTGRTEIPEEPITKKVIKVWNMGGSTVEHPDSVTVKLYGDGQLYDTQILSEENEWSYEWTELKADVNWVLAEDPVEGYTTKITEQGNTFKVENTYIPPETEPTEPTKPTEPTRPTEPTKPPRPNDPPVLPITGLSWWPVPAAIALGLMCLIIGMLIRKKGTTNESKNK